MSVKAYREKLKFYPLIVRENTSDVPVFESIFILGEFELPIKINPKIIVDAGAYTGLSALYYASRYPLADIVAIEPEKSNFEILEKNTKKVPGIKRIRAGLWSGSTFLKVVDMMSGKWGFSVKEVSESDDYDIKSITLDEVLTMYGSNKIDILKLDIEGAERELFSNKCSSWINKVNIIVIEFHDRLVEGCTEALYKSINRDDWNEYKKGEKVVLIRRKML